MCIQTNLCFTSIFLTLMYFSIRNAYGENFTVPHWTPFVWNHHRNGTPNTKGVIVFLLWAPVAAIAYYIQYQVMDITHVFAITKCYHSNIRIIMPNKDNILAYHVYIWHIIIFKRVTQPSIHTHEHTISISTNILRSITVV